MHSFVDETSHQHQTLHDGVNTRTTDLVRRRHHYQSNLERLKACHHAHCIFTKNPPIQDLSLCFDDTGVFKVLFTCDENHQGYDNRVHGGLLAAIADSSMVQCLMGHGIIAYTTELTMQYRKPVIIHRETTAETRIVSVAKDLLYLLRCEIFQNNTCAVRATGRFYRKKSEE
ncbi:MAG: PaaI family thioesterase [Chitinivibrionales bacterium]|nr:PaaI family thioesterase [Chitinivibrionales bacterium]